MPAKVTPLPAKVTRADFRRPWSVEETTLASSCAITASRPGACRG